jgi:hypothetical protein
VPCGLGHVGEPAAAEAVRAATAIGDEALRRTYGGPRPGRRPPDPGAPCPYCGAEAAVTTGPALGGPLSRCSSCGRAWGRAAVGEGPEVIRVGLPPADAGIIDERGDTTLIRLASGPVPVPPPVDATPDRPDHGARIKAEADSVGDLATWTLREPEPPIDLGTLWRRVARLPTAVRDALAEQFAAIGPDGELPPIALLDALIAAAERGETWPKPDAPVAEDSP